MMSSEIPYGKQRRERDRDHQFNEIMSLDIKSMFKYVYIRMQLHN